MITHKNHTPISTLKGALVTALKGFGMGVAEIIPGVSGGTVALILGIYERFIDSIKSYTPKSVLHFIKALPQSDERMPAAQSLHLDFLVPLMMGMGSAIVLVSTPMRYLLAEYPAHMNALFFGMIFASLYVPFAAMRNRQIAHYLLGVGGFLIAFWILGFPIASETQRAQPLVLFGAGAIAICAMVLPGVSGSYLLKAMGQYEHILDAIHERDLFIIAVVGAGIVCGIVIFVRIISWLLKRFHDETLAVLTGLMLGSLRTVWPWKIGGMNMPPESFESALPMIGLILAGIILVIVLIVADKKLGSPDIDEGIKT